MFRINIYKKNNLHSLFFFSEYVQRMKDLNFDLIQWIHRKEQYRLLEINNFCNDFKEIFYLILSAFIYYK